MKVFSTLMGLFAVVWFIVAAVAMGYSHYDKATTYILVAILLTMWENQAKEDE